MEIYLLGANHKTAEVEFRERIALSGEEMPRVLRQLLDLPAVNEGAIVSTCNRTEIYVVVDKAPDIYPTLEKFVRSYSGVDFDAGSNRFYRMMNEKAIHHLFQVAAGLDSMILGEPQILGQVKDAYRIASELNATGTILNRLFHYSFLVGKRIRNETALGAGAVSVAYAAVELAQKIFKDLTRRSVLLIGAGETGELTARHLNEKGIGNLFITNRTFSRAEDLARELNGKALPFEQMSEKYPEVDIIIGAATAPQHLITRADLGRVLHKRGARPLFMIDIGVPRNFDPEINKLESVFLHDIDNLQQIIDKNLEKRRQEIPKAEKIISEEIQHFQQWVKSLDIAPTVVSLRRHFEEIRRAEIQKHAGKLSDAEREKVELITRQLMNKYLHMPTVQLKKYGNGQADGLLRIDVVRELFGLEDGE
ncbi:MAG: glutamyl-tRNA reductase [Calditrichia bacterium]